MTLATGPSECRKELYYVWLLVFREGDISNDGGGRVERRVGIGLKLRALLWGTGTQRETKEFYCNRSFDREIESSLEGGGIAKEPRRQKALVPRGAKHKRKDIN